MRNDPIVTEVHRLRQEVLSRFNGDLDAYSRHIQSVETENRKRGVIYREVPPPDSVRETVVGIPIR